MNQKLKHILLVTFLMLATALTASAKDNAVIKMSERNWEFGTVHENGGPVSHEFEFVNTGTAPLVIISANASCGCTRPSYPQEPVKPGKKGKIKVTYLPQGRPGTFEKNVKVRTNDPKNKRITLTIRGNVVP